MNTSRLVWVCQVYNPEILLLCGFTWPPTSEILSETERPYESHTCGVSVLSLGPLGLTMVPINSKHPVNWKDNRGSHGFSDLRRTCRQDGTEVSTFQWHDGQASFARS